MKKLEQHQLSALWPPVEGPEFVELVADIKTHGLRQPITGHEGKVLDGWNRYRACLEAGVKVEMRALPRGTDPRAFVWSANGARRNVTVSQRVAIAVAMAEWTPSGRPRNVTGKGEPGSPLTTGEPSSPVTTVAGVAAATGVSERTVQQAKKGEAAGLGAAMRSGLVTAKEAAKLAAVAENPEADEEPGEAPADYSEADHERAQADEHEADFESMTKIIEADDKLAAAFAEIKTERVKYRQLNGLYEEKCRALAQMTSEAKRWMRKAKKSAACQDCMTALEREL